MRSAVGKGGCIRARRALSLVLDSEQVASDVRILAVHLGGCDSCRRYAADVSEFTRDLRSLRLEPPHDPKDTETKGPRS